MKAPIGFAPAAAGATRIAWAAVLGAALASGASGCFSMQSQSTLDNIQSAMTEANQPYVEGFIEYAGPQAKWAGPSSFLLHVVAKDAGPAQISVVPALFNEFGANPAVRGLAGEKDKKEGTGAKGISGEYARELLAHLATSLQGADQSFRGCLAPVRVRLVRADGAILEKQGCRGQTGWARVASDSVNRVITAALFGEPKRQPASVIAKPKSAAPEAAAGSAADSAAGAAGAAAASSAGSAAGEAAAAAAGPGAGAAQEQLEKKQQELEKKLEVKSP